MAQGDTPWAIHIVTTVITSVWGDVRPASMYRLPRWREVATAIWGNLRRGGGFATRACGAQQQTQGA